MFGASTTKTSANFSHALLFIFKELFDVFSFFLPWHWLGLFHSPVHIFACALVSDSVLRMF